jgi:hypothetical protein
MGDCCCVVVALQMKGQSSAAPLQFRRTVVHPPITIVIIANCVHSARVVLQMLASNVRSLSLPWRRAIRIALLAGIQIALTAFTFILSHAITL